METLKDWLVTFGKIIIRPSAGTFRTEAKKAKGKLGSAIAWIVLQTVAYHLINFVARGFTDPMDSVFAMLFIFPIEFIFFVFCLHLMGKRLFHLEQDHYEEIVYLMAGILLPFMSFSYLVGLLPDIGTILGWAITMYIPVLMVIAIKAVTRLRVGQTIVVVVLSVLLAGVGALCIPLFFFRFLSTIPKFF
jgi:hypothetical protein